MRSRALLLVLVQVCVACVQVGAPSPQGPTGTGAPPTSVSPAMPTGAAPTGAAPTGAAPSGAAPSGQPSASPVGGTPAEPLRDVIAYVPSATSDEIRLIDPDGSDDRPLWAHGQDDPFETYDVWSLAWRPDSRELAFASTHENWCSLNASDIFVVGSDGSGYRRVTQPPACADLSGYPTGTVRVPIRNDDFFGESFTGFVYFQGAPGIQPVSLAPGATGEVVFEGVADLGDGVLQLATVIGGTGRAFDVGTAVDVVAGTTVTSNNMAVYSPDITWEPRSPAWHSDGSRLAYVYGFNSLFGIDADPEPLDFGSSLVEESTGGGPNIVLHLGWGTTAATADSILYQGNELGMSEGIYLASEGGGAPGERLVEYASTDMVRGLAWLPDGSGFVYSVTESALFGAEGSGEIVLFDLTTRESTSVIRLPGEFTGLLSVSGDGGQIVFERAPETNMVGSELIGTDLWIVDRDGGGLRLLKEDALAPAWSW